MVWDDAYDDTKSNQTDGSLLTSTWFSTFSAGFLSLWEFIEVLYLSDARKMQIERFEELRDASYIGITMFGWWLVLCFAAQGTNIGRKIGRALRRADCNDRRLV
ncbi:MAG: hypothetical protein MHM6MM_005126 [Cercozoa sp. M6MM]